MSRWVIIGGTGYIGAALCHQLAESGLPVVSVSRAPQGNPCCAGNALYTHQSISLSPGTDPGFVFQPGDRVIYAAGLADRRQCERQPGLARWLNSDCPLILLQAADARGAESFTYLSSVKAMRPPRGVLADEGAGEPAGDAYGRSKWDGERQLLSFAAACRVNIIRPAAVYGESVSEGAAGSPRRAGRLRALVRRLGRFLPVVPASGRRSFVSLPDLVNAIVMVAGASHCRGQVFIAAEPRFYDLAGILSDCGVRTSGSESLTRLVLGPLRPLRALPQVRALLELDASELYSAARLRRALAWKAERRYSQYLRGNL
ncbi:NAD-dependent epimerase/dehydratase family protein [Microbulbifer sp. YPW16]|uniref:NAD-dependent epimerase/dehydratase family protein n=1 Tax=Microbulbifer sp. YPW16 TaxID=2904242 RepID=UPI001E4BFCD6|nr:NAD-dependent epimerase/dehydratase family protein [Microbulbifer sp. YPW16]UHQ55308.1 NAD-dependent epimerase/dehydratase family protein [Microbulbifer sp. YPW16]